MKRKENPFFNLLANIIIPSLIMIKGDAWFHLPPLTALLIALAFPTCYGLIEFIIQRKYNFISILGFVSILLTGGIGLLQLPPQWVAYKEASVPLIIGFVVLATMRGKKPFIQTLLLNDQILNLEAVQPALDNPQAQSQFTKLLNKATYLIAASFFLSAFLNFTLAKVIVKSTPGTAAFTQEIGRMTALSYPVIVLPCMVIVFFTLFYLINGLKRITGLPLEQVFKS